MPRRPDGRIEPGQRLSTAISARAWNRAQDTADIVLGERPVFGAEAAAAFPSSLVVPCLVSSGFEDIGYGHAVRINSAVARAPDLRPDRQGGPQTFLPEFARLSGSIQSPAVFSSNINTFRNQHSTPFGVIVGGDKMPSPGSPQVVKLCIAGMCFARIRSRGVTTGYVQPALRRVNTDTTQDLAGCLENSDSGVARLFHILTGPQSTPLILSANNGALFITWGLVCL